MKSMKSVLALAAMTTLGLVSAQANVVLNGNVLRVGVHSSGGLINNSFTVGIDYDETGTGSWTGYDFLKPGTAFEFYSVGVNGSSSAAGYYYGDPFSSTTSNTSSGSTLSTLTTGSYGLLGISQELWYTTNGGTINFSVSLTNNGTVAMNNVAYARGLDPDQDVYAGGGYPTTNTIVSNDLVVGTAPVTDWTIGIYSDSSYTHTPTVRSSWPYGDAYGLQTARNDGYGDYSINMAWAIGTLEAGETATIDFEYRIAETQDEVITPPSVPETASTIGLFGLAMAALIGARRWQVRS